MAEGSEEPIRPPGYCGPGFRSPNMEQEAPASAHQVLETCKRRGATQGAPRSSLSGSLQRSLPPPPPSQVTMVLRPDGIHPTCLVTSQPAPLDSGGAGPREGGRGQRKHLLRKVGHKHVLCGCVCVYARGARMFSKVSLSRSKATVSKIRPQGQMWPTAYFVNKVSSAQGHTLITALAPQQD